MKYPVISIEAAQDLYSKFVKGEDALSSAFEKLAGNGDVLDRTQVDALLSDLQNLRAQINEEPSLPKAKGANFEGPASKLVHDHLRISPVVATSREFWLWLTFVACDKGFLNIVKWRFGSQQSIARENFGLTSKASIWEGLFARLWLRGRVGYCSDQSNSYDLAVRGSVDFWRSHIFRQDYGRCANVARELIRFQYPDESPDEARLKIKGIRELAKRLRIIHVTYALETLTSAQIHQLIEENAGSLNGD